MAVFIKLSLLTCLLLPCSFAFAQKDINDEAFVYHFIPSKTGGDIFYIGKKHSFSLNINGSSVNYEPVKLQAENQNFIKIGKDVIQTSLVNLPQPIPPAMHLSNLTVKETTETLEGYVNYELGYFDKELHINPRNVKKEWKTIGSKLCLIWYFEFEPHDADVSEKVIAQVYLSVVCFNQVLDINTPIYKGDVYENSKIMLENIAKTLKTYNEKLGIAK